MSAPVQEGDLLNGKFRIDKVLGEGGMGVVVAATNVALEQRVAIKFLLPEAAANEEVRARFAREARAAVKIHSEHVVRVIDVGELTDGAPFMVMEFLEGEDLSSVIEKRGALPYRQAVSYILEACVALAEAHKAGIIHRDLKPPNLFLATQADGSQIIKVLDFGISKTLDPASHALTKTSALMGSPFYMSPEQLVSSKYVDARSDIWALGIILYELISGIVPFSGETLPEIVAAILQNKPTPLSQMAANLPPDLLAAVNCCLRTEVDERFTNVAALARALESFGEEQSSRNVARIVRVLGEPSSATVKESASKVPAARKNSGAATLADMDNQALGRGTAASTGTSQPPLAEGAQTKTGLQSDIVPEKSPGMARAIGVGLAMLLLGAGAVFAIPQLMKSGTPAAPLSVETQKPSTIESIVPPIPTTPLTSLASENLPGVAITPIAPPLVSATASATGSATGHVASSKAAHSKTPGSAAPSATTTAPTTPPTQPPATPPTTPPASKNPLQMVPQ